ncbi:MAG: TonB-dependent receptor plug domain-containing protein [Xanthomonadales bacterium]|nr:TonB-dependent receptor plug domain-containing protein [Xanthomonadales bacterium]
MSLKRNFLSLALASAFLSVAGQARAEAAPDPKPEPAPEPAATPEPQTQAAQAEEAADELDAVVVVGLRGGLKRSIDLKAERDTIVEAVSAEDLGKLPDISIADSISRLPGITAQRVAGRASTISIRGLAGDYGTTLLNGREQVSVGDNRTVEFDQFPSELINQVLVYKTADAGLVGQGLSGTVDLRTVRPLQFRERVASVNLRGEKNSLGALNADSDDIGNRFSAFYVDQLMDGQLGVALGYARLDSPGQAQRWEAWGFPTDIGGAPGANTLGGGKIQASSTDNLRQGLMGVLEYKGSNNYNTTLDFYWSKFDRAETTRFLEVGLGWSGARLTGPTIRDNVTVAGTFEGVRPVLRNDLNEGDDKLFAIGWNNEWSFGDGWTATADLSHSRADRQESILETYAGTRPGTVDNVAFALDPFRAPQFTFSRNYADPATIVLTDPGGWGQDGYIKKPEIDDKLTSVRVDFEKVFAEGMFSSVKFGLNRADRSKQRQVPEAFLDLLNNRAPVSIAQQFLIRPVDLSHAGVPKQWRIDEEVTTAYLQANLSTQIGEIPVRGNIGVQVIHADQSSDGFSVIQGNAADAVPFSGGVSYTDVLPSANLVFELNAENVVRFGAGRQQARPRVDQMRANNNTSLEVTGPNAGRYSRNGGNPELRPWEANAFDLAWENYFIDGGYVALAYFYKDLRTYVYDQTTGFDTAGLLPPVGYTGPTPQPVGVYSRPANGEGGNIKGWEFSLSLPFNAFSEALDGFGLIANYSDTSSSIKRLGPDGPDEPIAGLSERVTNVTLYYENHGFSARVSQRSRSDFLGEIQGFGADRAQVFIDGESVVDFQTGYTFGSGALENVSLLLQVNNLTDEPYRQFFQQTGLTQRYEEYGRQYLLGVTYRF